MKHEYVKGQVRCKLQGVSYIVSKRHELWFTNGLKLEVYFTHLHKICILFQCQASQTEVNK